MRRQRKQFDDETEVDMTPMLDIVFIMLIFFIVTTSFVKEDGIVLDRPAANPPQDQQETPNRPIVIAINDNSEVSIGGRLVDVEAVRANVETARSQKPKALVIVQAHESAKSGVVVRAVDQAKQAGAEKVTVVKPAS
ncbi:biopolymer transporter ExbD [Aliikangiella sp. G2MR2-5]|uniref:ExbD/TolR family protein n=1 Tax=Aliikangiella sp. G2MR2-5 TaxID=2788943 RepID=UPI0018A894DB|nr:biopolymer transporter ExbD [Aliikangiella sp. G2MR2-5]